MWLLRKVVPNSRCIADFRKDNAKAIREVFKAFVKMCNKAGLQKQLTEALAQMEDNVENQICTTDPECRLMKTRNGIRPNFNVQTAAEPDNHLIVHYDVTNECADWNLPEDGINGAKAAPGAEPLEGIADRDYGNNDGVLQCLLNGDTPTREKNAGFSGLRKLRRK